MNYTEYLELLKKNNIELFDYDKRISYHNIKKFKLNNNQTGGGVGNYLKNKSQFEFKNIINLSLCSTPNLLISFLN